MPPTESAFAKPFRSREPTAKPLGSVAIATSEEHLHLQDATCSHYSFKGILAMRERADEPSAMLPIGAMAKRTGLTVEGIRFYEKAGILHSPARTAGRHRAYGLADLKRLRFIRRARQLGFSLDDVRTLLGLADDTGHHNCADAHRLGSRHLHDVRAKIRDLRKMEKALRGMVASCAEGTLPACPLIETLCGN